MAGCLVDTIVSFYAVSKDSYLRREGSLMDPFLPWQRIRVVGLLGKAWQIDPIIEQDQVQ